MFTLKLILVLIQFIAVIYIFRLAYKQVILKQNDDPKFSSKMIIVVILNIGISLIVNGVIK